MAMTLWVEGALWERGLWGPERVGTWSEGGDMAAVRPTLKTLAQHLGISITTASRALKDGPEVNAETIRRVKAAALELGYRQGRSGVQLRTGRTLAVTALIGDRGGHHLGDTWPSSLVQGMLPILSAADYTLIEMPRGPGRAPLSLVQRVVEDGLVDGVVLDQTSPDDERVRYLQDNKFPFVTFGRTELPHAHAYLDVENEGAAHLATMHLARRNHRRIAFLEEAPIYTYSRDRYEGYRRGLVEAGLPFDAGLVRQGPVSAEAARTFAEAMMRRSDAPTAFVSPSEIATLGLLTGLRDAGVDLSAIEIASRDGTYLTRFLWPSPISFYVSMIDIGRRLAELLLQRIDGGTPESLQEMVDVTLV